MTTLLDRFDNPIKPKNKLDKARDHFIAACAASREWNKRVKLCYELYGDHGPQISGIARDCERWRALLRWKVMPLMQLAQRVHKCARCASYPAPSHASTEADSTAHNHST